MVSDEEKMYDTICAQISCTRKRIETLRTTKTPAPYVSKQIASLYDKIKMLRKLREPYKVGHRENRSGLGAKY